MVLQHWLSKSNKLKYIVLFCCFTLLIVYGSLNPEKCSVFPQCPFKLLTGFDCAGCGSQRAIHHLLNLNLIKAFESNSLLVISIPYLILLFFAERFELKNDFAFRINQKLQNHFSIRVVFLVIVFWWVGRNFVL